MTGWARRHPFLSTMLVVGAILLSTLVHPVLRLAATAWSDQRSILPLPPGTADDFSRLDQVSATVIPVCAQPHEAELQLAALLAQARREHRHVAIAGARHSEGGHVLYPGGLIVDMLPWHGVVLDEPRRLVHAQAGALWSQIIPLLDAHGLAIDIMQSDASFSVGGSLSVNCHGWQPGRPPICASVDSFRLMLADGAIVRCSRQEHPELFALVLGGYGLFGIILDADLRVVSDECYHLQRLVMPVERFAETYRQRVLDRQDVGLAFGRLCVARSGFLEQAILTIAKRVPPPADGIPRMRVPGISRINRTVFRASADSDYGKELRWRAERDWQGLLTPDLVTRNEMMSGDVDEYVTRNGMRTDLLQEYFVPCARFGDFIARLREILPEPRPDLLNITIREVQRDRDTVLRYADQPMLAVVLFFECPRTQAADQEVQTLTQRIIAAALGVNGRYYLPYRLHATPAQFAQAYPMAGDFFRAKRRFDPEGVFQNEFFLRYAAASDLPSGTRVLVGR